MDRAPAHERAARVQRGTVSLDGQCRRAVAADRWRHDRSSAYGWQLEPSSWKVRLGSRWGVGVSLKKSLERVYLRIDATLKSQRQRGVSPRVDPFEEPA